MIYFSKGWYIFHHPTLGSCVEAACKVSWLVAENNGMSFFELFQYCLGSGLGTIGDFFSAQLLHDPPSPWRARHCKLCGLSPKTCRATNVQTVMASRLIRAHKPTHHVKGQHLGRRCKYFILPSFVNVASFLKSNCQNWFRIYSGIHRVLYLVYECFLFLPVNRIKTETGTSILIPSNNEHSNILRIEGSPKGVALAKEEILQMVKKLVSKTSPQVFLLLHGAPNLLLSSFRIAFSCAGE